MKRLDEIFDIWYGVNLEVVNCEVVSKGMPFVSRQSGHNGVVCHVRRMSGVKPNPAWSLSIAGGGSVLATFFHDSEYYSGRDIYIAKPKVPMSAPMMLYYCAAIEQNKFRYSYGRQANKTLKGLLVPSLDEVPKEIRNKAIESPLSAYAASSVPYALDTDKWKWFPLGKLFEIKKGKRLTKADMIPGAIRYIGAIDSNNGVSAHISNDAHLHPTNTITVSYNGSIAEAFYQEQPFWATDDVNVLYPKFPLNRHRAMFLCAIIGREKYRFSYGRKWDKDLMVESPIRLPATPEGEPDWKWMENYIKGLPYSAAL